MIYQNKNVSDIRIAYIGGGSRGWAWTLMKDLAKAKDISGTVALYDIDFAAAKDKGIEAVWALSLPGKYAPESAGAIIADVLDELFESEGLI